MRWAEFHSCQPGASIVQRLGSSIGSSCARTALILDRPFFRPEYAKWARIVRALCAVTGRCRQRLAAAVAVTVAVNPEGAGIKMEEMPGLRRENVMIAAADTGLVPMRVSKAVALGDGDGLSAFMVLDELEGDRHLVIGVGDAEAFALDASLQGLRWGRPMTYEFTVALVRSLGGRVREVRLDRIVEGAYAATVEVEGPRGVHWSMLDPAMRSTSRS